MPFDGSKNAAPVAKAEGPMEGLQDPFTPKLYAGRIMHLRTRPARHQFRYGVTALWIDVDAPEAAADQLRLLSIDRFGAYSFYRRDHGARDGSDLRPFVEDALATIDAPKPDRIMLLSMPRVLGYVFNPLSVYFCYGSSGALQSIVYEVKNTVGGQHAYPVRIFEGEDSLRHAANKCFYVSPFIGMDKRYNFTVAPPSDRLALLIKLTDSDGLYLSASWNGEAEPLSDRNLLRRLLTRPFSALKVIIAIYFEALRLRLKGVRILGRPQPQD